MLIFGACNGKKTENMLIPFLYPISNFLYYLFFERDDLCVYTHARKQVDLSKYRSAVQLKNISRNF